MKRLMVEETCCFTGHRKLSSREKKRVHSALERTVECLIQAGIRFFGTGGALGFDAMAAQTVLKLRSRYPQIRLILVLPCRSQTRGWKKEDIQTYETIRAAADKVKYICEEYTWDCMYRRNRHLVDHSSVCVCYLTKRQGGTAYTVNYAKTQGCSVINLAEMCS